MTMNVLIIEDEELAARRLEKMIYDYDPAIRVVATLESVEESIDWFRNHAHPDLIFLDIHLEDDLSFIIFEHVEVKSPIIFTTAFDEYAIRAFKLRSIDYLLKPIVQEDLNHAIAKYMEWRHEEALPDLSSLYELITRSSKVYRDRYSVSFGQKIRSFLVSDVAWFHSMQGETYAHLFDNQEYPVDYSLDTIASETDPNGFFRVNRKYFVSHKAIRQVHVYPKSRLKLELNPKPQEDIFVSIDKVTAFKLWYGE
jgi:DNA-binding LytR/AlgR family response regulator